MHAFYAPHRPLATTVTQPAFSRTHLAGTLASTDGNELLGCPHLVPASAVVHHGMTTDASRTCQLPRTHGKPQSGCEQRAMWCMGCACAQAYVDTQPNLGMVAAATANSV